MVRIPGQRQHAEWMRSVEHERTWIVTAGNVGKRLAVRVIPRVTTGTPNQGAQVESEKTGIVASGSHRRH
jgi:hypothetical protein